MAGSTPENIAKARLVIEFVADGLTIQAAVGRVDLPIRDFYRAISGVNELAGAYAQAKEHRAELSADEIIEIADNTTLDPQQARNMIDARKWRAAKQHSRVYGDRVDVQFSGQVNVLEILDRAKLQSIRNLAPIIDAEVIDQPTLSTRNTSDCESEGQVKDEPSIFD